MAMTITKAKTAGSGRIEKNLEMAKQTVSTARLIAEAPSGLEFSERKKAVSPYDSVSKAMGAMQK